MTKAEYQAKYGVQPVVSTSTLDNDPIPVRMTRAEYNALYRPATPDTSIIGDLKTGFQNAVSAVDSGVQREAEMQNRGFLSKQFGRFTSGIQTAGDVVGSLAEGAFRALPGGTTVANKIGEVTQAGAEAVAESSVGQGAKTVFRALPEGVQTTATDIGRGALGALNVGGALVAPGAVSAVSRPVVRSAGEVITDVAKRSLPTQTNKINRVAEEIADIENAYSKTRMKLDRDPNTVASRSRIAQSNVLEGAVDEDGLVRTKQKGGAIDRYKTTPITSDGLTLLDVEDVVKRNLETEGKSVNINELKTNILGGMMDSGLEGADLASAIRRIDKDLEGLSIRADKFGNVLLDKIQDAKIATTKNIDYSKPVGTTYRKTLARIYKETIEDKSDLPVRDWNQELAKYYKDIDRLADLDGKRVKGGRLGKLTANVTGSAIGAVAGSAGGATGAFIGGAVGGQVTQKLAGRAMARTFSSGIDGKMPESPTLAQAQARAGVKDLTSPDRPVGVPKSIMTDPDLPEFIRRDIVRTEGQLKKNVEQQKAAIKAGDFTLVAALKEVYTALVDKLKTIIDDYKALPEQTPEKPIKKEVKKVFIKEDTIKKSEQRLQDLLVEKDVLKNSVETNPARQLQKYMARGDNSLAQIQKNAEETGGKSVALDDIVTELGFVDLSDAQTAVESYRRDLSRLSELDDIIRDEKQFIKKLKDTTNEEIKKINPDEVQDVNEPF